MSTVPSGDFVAAVQADSSYVIWTVVGLVLYYLTLKAIWRGFLYIVFGGLEDDAMKKNEGTAHQPASQVSPPSAPSEQRTISDKDKKEIGFYIFILIMIGLIYWIYSYDSPAPYLNNNNNNSNKTTCIPTGCGSQWRCDGSYYDANGTQRSLHACLPRRAGEIYSSWSGTCRRCP